ncbi:hypothetical protein HNQ00_000417 [Flavobacterium sp. 14A]|nr:hypothetical protein [Flavobacterium sp. 14A]
MRKIVACIAINEDAVHQILKTIISEIWDKEE